MTSVRADFVVRLKVDELRVQHREVQSSVRLTLECEGSPADLHGKAKKDSTTKVTLSLDTFISLHLISSIIYGSVSQNDLASELHSFS